MLRRLLIYVSFALVILTLGAGCGDDKGACCRDDGTCAELTQSDCEDTGGTFLGDGEDCDSCEKDFFTFRFGPSELGGPTYYYYVPWDHISEFSPTTPPCGLYGYDIDGGHARRENAGDNTVATDPVWHPDPNTYVQFDAEQNGQACGPAPMGSARFQFNGVYFSLFGPLVKAFPNAEGIQPAADRESDVYWSGEWEIEGNETTRGSFDFWPYLYDSGHPPPGRP